MIEEKKDVILFTDKIPGKGVSVTLWSDDLEQITKFRALMRANCMKELNWFHQCNSRQYQMFEFWTPSTIQIRAIGEFVSKEMNLSFKEDLSKDYVKTGCPDFSDPDPWSVVQEFAEQGKFFG